MVRNGMQAFIVDYSGYGFSEGKATRNNVLKDCVASLKYLHSRPDVQNTSLVIYGQSTGSHFGPAAAAAYPEYTDGMVLEGDFPTYHELITHMYWYGFLARVLVKEKYSMPKALKQYHKPLLVIHSSEDEIVPLHMGREVFNLANNPKSYFEIAKCHICGPVFYGDKISEKIFGLVAK